MKLNITLYSSELCTRGEGVDVFMEFGKFFTFTFLESAFLLHFAKDRKKLLKVL
jgi:hypothetical protein